MPPEVVHARFNQSKVTFGLHQGLKDRVSLGWLSFPPGQELEEPAGNGTVNFVWDTLIVASRTAKCVER
jgi:hypothetical protein